LSDDEGAAARGHITNYAQNVDGTVWSLDMLKEHLGELLLLLKGSNRLAMLTTELIVNTKSVSHDQRCGRL
jgi:hypothetical protein